MPIEFNCTQCGNPLRTPDGTEGRQAKCPQCGAVMQIPFAASAAPQPTPAPGPASPFAPEPQAGEQQGWNPYASPSIGGESAQQRTGSVGELAPTRIDFNEVLGATWRIFRAQMGTCVIAGLVVIGLYIGLFFVAGVLGAIAAIGQGPQFVPGPAGPPGAPFAVQTNPMAELLGNIIGWLGGAWIQMGVTVCFLKIARGQPASAGDLFTGSPFYSRGLVVMGIYTGVAVAATLVGFVNNDAMTNGAADIVGGIVSFILSLFFALALPFIVDRNLSAGDALSKSMQFMDGNKLTLFGIELVTGIVGGLFCVFTCGIGILFFVPFVNLLPAVLYLQAAGQPTADVRPAPAY